MSKNPSSVKNEKCIAMDLEKGFVVTWDCSNGATSYKIVRKRVTKGKDVAEQTFNISSDEYRKGNKIIFNDKSDKISANSEYRYVITAINSYGSSISKTTNDAKPGTPPQSSVKRITTKFIFPVAPTIPAFLKSLTKASILAIATKKSISIGQEDISKIQVFLKELKKIFSKIKTPDEINLQWVPISRANLYRVYKQDTSYTLLAETSSTSVTLKRTQLENGLVFIEPANGWGSSTANVPFCLLFDGTSVTVIAL